LFVALALALTGCSTQQVGNAVMTGAAVIAPVVRPFTMSEEAREREKRDRELERAEDERRRGYQDSDDEKLRVHNDIKAGNLAASLYCVFNSLQSSCSTDSNGNKNKSIERLAAAQVIAAYQEKSAMDFRQQAELIVAHYVSAESLRMERWRARTYSKEWIEHLDETDPMWKENSRIQMEHYNEVLRLAQSHDMWNYIYREKGLGQKYEGWTKYLDAEQFKVMVTWTVIHLIALEHESRVLASGNPDLPMICDLTPYLTPLALAREKPPYQAICEKAEFKVPSSLRCDRHTYPPRGCQ
jgi:hypothetical protein